MILRKWNYKAHEYEPFEVPDDWNCKTYCTDMSEIVNCPHCGARLLFGNSFTSLEVHTATGMGYGICGKCHEAEVKRNLEAMHE